MALPHTCTTGAAARARLRAVAPVAAGYFLGAFTGEPAGPFTFYAGLVREVTAERLVYTDGVSIPVADLAAVDI